MGGREKELSLLFVVAAAADIRAGAGDVGVSWCLFACSFLSRIPSNVDDSTHYNYETNPSLTVID